MVKIDGKPRLCKLNMWPDFDGYGFNLHAEKSRPGQYVGKVDEGSPAEAAGLREGDRIIEVNGFNISSENHKQVVSRIKSVPNETNLLVVDVETDKIYRESGLVISSEDAIVITSTREEATTEDEEEVDRKSLVSNDSSIDKRNLVEAESSLYIPTHGKIRSCHIIKSQPSESFGFSIQTIKKENTKFIKEISPGGPADRSGLLLDDVVLAVNGENVIEETHKSVVDRIISRELDTTLLVTDKETFNYCLEHKIPLLPNPERTDSCKGVPSMEGPEHAEGSGSSRTSTTIEATIESSPRIVVEDYEEEMKKSTQPERELSLSEAEYVEEVTITHVNHAEDILSSKEIPVDEDIPIENEEVPNEHHTNMGSTGNSPSPRSTPSPQFSNHATDAHLSASPVNGVTSETEDDLNLNMTAAEMRQKISAKKKRDPRKDDRMDILRKYQIIQTL